MAPVRRYLRITKYSVLECRIYLDNPALGQTWLLNPRDPALPRVIEAVRPLVLPKLREEKERAAKKKTPKNKKTIKDTLVQEDFEVAIFLTETNTRHSLLYKHKHFRDKTQTKLVSNSSRLTGESRDAPIDVETHDLQIRLEDETPEETEVPALRREDDGDEDDAIELHDIPALDDTTLPESRTRQSKRRRGRPIVVDASDEESESHGDDSQHDSDDAFLSDGDGDGGGGGNGPPPKRLKDAASAAEKDDKKKLAMDTSYEGFAIYGRVLCLVVKRREPANRIGGVVHGARGAKSQTGVGGQATMENWIASTQLVMAEEPADAS